MADSPDQPAMRKCYYVYVMASARNGTLYVGMTSNIRRRVWEHREGTVDGFTKRYGVKVLVYVETFEYVWAAIQRENRLKKWKRRWKLELIEKDNPNWDDLFYSL